MKVGEILRLATNDANGDPATRAENINSLCVHLQKVLKFHHRLQMVICYLKNNWGIFLSCFRNE
jgi:hypothetical protein